MKNKTPKSIQGIILGSALIALSLGSIYWIPLIRYGQFIFLIASASSIYYLLETIPLVKISKTTKTIGFVGINLLMLSLGIQTTGLPFKNIILLIGVIFIAYGIFKNNN